jgi:hypothetical protein
MAAFGSRLPGLKHILTTRSARKSSSISTRFLPPAWKQSRGVGTCCWVRREPPKDGDSYAYPAPNGSSDAQPTPKEAYFDQNLREFLRPYEAVRRSSDPEGTLMSFLESTYSAAADRGGWNRNALDCPIGEPLRPRPSNTGKRRRQFPT